MDGAGSSGAPPYAGLTPLPIASAVSGGASAGQRTPGGSPFPSPRGGRTAYSDRFIPSRALSSRLDASPLEREAAAAEVPRRGADREDGNGAYNLLLRSELLSFGAGAASPEKPAPAAGGAAPPPGSPHRSPGRSIFRYATGGAGAPAAGAPLGSPFSRGLVGGDGAAAAAAGPARLPRRIPRAPFKVLDAPALADDFYLNLVDWSSQNVLAVGLGASVYLWSACTSKVTRLADLGDGAAVCSVAWSGRGAYLAVGTDRGEVQIWDAARGARVRALAGHKQRVGVMAWGGGALATGSRDRAVLLRDVRAPDAYTARLGAHRSEVCGLKWSPDERELASGGNDNQLLVWAPAGATAPGVGGSGAAGRAAAAALAPIRRFAAHTAAVKAIAWSPHQHGLLASGGGTADRCIRFWSSSTGAALSAVDTGSQVCNLSWSKNCNEIVSTHGYSQNQICVWRYPGMAKLATLTGHTMRVLYLAASPDGQTVVTGAGDETLRFWNVFPGPRTAAGGGDGGVGAMARTTIR